MKKLFTRRAVAGITKILFSAAFSLAFLQGQTARCDIINWTFGGTITQGLAGSPYQAGLSYTANFAVDTSLTTPATSGLYYPSVGYNFKVGSSAFSSSSTGSGVLIDNDQALAGGGSFDGIIFSMFGEPDSGFPTGAAFDGSAFGITLVNNSTGPTATPFTDTSFPSTLNLNQFSQRYMTVYFQSGSVEGTVTTLSLNNVLVSQVVPEPGSMGLFAAAGLLFGFNRTRCRMRRL